MILVGLVVFGFYKFQELSQQRDVDLQRVRETATESYRQQLSAANKALVETYQAMGSISGTQIKNLSEMLELHAKATTRTQELQQAQEQQRLKLDQALREVENAGNQKKQFEVDLKNIQDNVARDKAELERLETALTEGRRNLSDSAVQVSTVRTKMIELANAVHSGEILTGTRLAAEILKENADTIDIKPGGSDANALKALIGRSDTDTVADLAKTATFVLRTTARRGDNLNGSRLLAGHAPSGPLFRNVTQLESDGSRIVGTGVASLFGAAMPDEDDWYSVSKSIIAHGENSSSGWDRPKDQEMWSLDDIPNKEILKGFTGALPFLNLTQLEKEAPDIFSWFKDSAFGELPSGMAERAKTFEADSLFPVLNTGELSGIPRELRDTAVRLFNAAVKHQMSEAATLIANNSSSPVSPGQLAAIILRPDFELTRYMPPTENDPGNAASSASLVGHYDYKTSGFRRTGFARERIATFVFSRKGGTGWQLEKLSSAPKEPVSGSR